MPTLSRLFSQGSFFQPKPLFACLAAIAALGLGDTWHIVQASRAGDGYAPVTQTDVAKLEFNHYYSTDKKYQPGDTFAWSFTEKEFTIKEGKGPIPADLLAKLLPPKTSAKTIQGKWTLEQGKQGGTSLVLTKIKADGKPGLDKAVFRIYRTAPTVIRIGDPQYVFSLL